MRLGKPWVCEDATINMRYNNEHDKTSNKVKLGVVIVDVSFDVNN